MAQNNFVKALNVYNNSPVHYRTIKDNGTDFEKLKYILIFDVCYIEMFVFNFACVLAVAAWLIYTDI